MASRELNIPLSYIHLPETSTITVPNTVRTAGSMGTDINGRAVQVTFLLFLGNLMTMLEGYLSHHFFNGSRNFYGGQERSGG